MELVCRDDREFVELTIRNGQPQNLQLAVETLVFGVEVKVDDIRVFDRGDGPVDQREFGAAQVRGGAEQAHLAKGLAVLMEVQHDP